MYKVVIIDDEPIIRKGLKNIVNWKNFSCEVCGEGSDGAEGRELIKTHLPDIIITDIRMPELDGLGMIRDIKELVPGSKIIILTGYRDFDYVQEALKLGAFDFILKPSRIEELTSVIGRAVKELKFMNDRNEEIEKLRKLFEQNIPILREKLLYDIIYGININEEEILSKMELFGIHIGKYSLVLVENEMEEDAGKVLGQYDKHLYQFGIVNAFDEIFSDSFKVVSISLNEKYFAFIITPREDPCSYADEINRKCAYLQEIIRNCFGFTVTVAVSSEGNGAMQLSSKLKECRQALEHKFYIGNSSIIFYNDLNSFFVCQDYTELENQQKALLEGIRSGNMDTVKAILGRIFNAINGLGPADRDYVRNFFCEVISQLNNIKISVQTMDNEKNTEIRDISSLYLMIEKCDNLKDLNGILEEAALRTTEKINSYNNRSMKLVLRRAVDFLQLHYSDPVTLNEVAEHSFVSTCYLSRIFKKELDKNFVDFLNEIRIEKAKELLGDVRYKTYEIAEKVGIPDAHYFSKLFKKYAGLTPTEYKDSVK